MNINYSTNEFENAKRLLTQVQNNKLLICGLFYGQLLEFMLRKLIIRCEEIINNRIGTQIIRIKQNIRETDNGYKLLERLKNYIPDQKNFFTIIKNCLQDRNEFIHASFKSSIDPVLNIADFHNNQDAIQYCNKFLKSWNLASKEIIKLFENLRTHS